MRSRFDCLLRLQAGKALRRGRVPRLSQAIRLQRALHVRYTSMTSGAHYVERIAPTRFTSDDESVHLRAFSFKHEAYRTYLPLRIGTRARSKNTLSRSQFPSTRTGIPAP